MKIALHVNASPLGQSSRAYRLARQAAANLAAKEGGVVLVERDLAAKCPSPITAHYADAIARRAETGLPVFEESETLIRELDACDYLIVSTPMHNFSVPASLKLWIDYVLRDGRTFTYRDGYKLGLLRDRPTLVIVGSGSEHDGPHARQPDYLSPYFTYVLATIGIEDVHFIRLQGLVQPDLAAEAIASGERQLAANPVFGLTSLPEGS